MENRKIQEKSNDEMKTQSKGNLEEEIEIKEQENQIVFQDLGIDMIKEIGKYLSPGEKVKMISLQNIALSRQFRKEVAQELKKLATLVLRGEKEAVRKVLSEGDNVYLLLPRITIKDLSGRIICGTILQLALGAEDISLSMKKGEREEMAEMIEKFLMRIPKGEIIIAQQKQQQFPDGWKELEDRQFIQDKRALDAVFDSIQKASNPEDCWEAISMFRTYLIPKRILDCGKHFNANLLIQALQLYKDYYEEFEKVVADIDKNSLITSQVFGAIEFYLPANYAQALCAGLCSMRETNWSPIPLKWRIEPIIKLEDDLNNKFVSFYFHDPEIKKGLGFSYALFSYEGEAVTTMPKFYIDEVAGMIELMKLWVAQKEKALSYFLQKNQLALDSPLPHIPFMDQVINQNNFIDFLDYYSIPYDSFTLKSYWTILSANAPRNEISPILFKGLHWEENFSKENIVQLHPRLIEALKSWSACYNRLNSYYKANSLFGRSDANINEENFSQFLNCFKINFNSSSLKNYWDTLSNELGESIYPASLKDFTEKDWENLEDREKNQELPLGLIKVLKEWVRDHTSSEESFSNQQDKKFKRF